MIYEQVIKVRPDPKSQLQNSGRNEREFQKLLHAVLAEFWPKIIVRILVASYVEFFIFLLQNSGTNFRVWTLSKEAGGGSA